MARPKNLQGALDRQDNEWYTLYSSVEYVFNNVDGLKEYVKDKILYLPCDTEESNIYKYLINNKEELQIKEILHTSDDYYKHHDLYIKADIVITNPPFTKISKWILFLYEMNKEFIIWAPFTVFQYKSLSYYVIKDQLRCICQNTKELNYFERPDGSIKQAGRTIIISNIYDFKSYSKKLEIDQKNTMEYLKQNGKIVYYKDIPILKGIKDFPCDYNGPIYITFSAVMDYRNEFIFVNYKQIDQREGRANEKYSNGVCVTKNCYEVFKLFDSRNKNSFCEGINHMQCYEVFLRDDKYFRNVNEEQFRALYAVKKNGSDAKLEDYIQEEKINKLF